MSDEPVFEFACPHCGQRIEVNASMRAALVHNGCVVCGSRVTDGAFSRTIARS